MKFNNINKNNRTIAAFINLIIDIINNNFFRYSEVLIIDNARVYIGIEAKIIEDLLQNTVVDVK